MKPLVSLLFFLVAVGGGALCGYCVKPLSAEQWEAYNALLRGDITEEPSVQSSTWTQAVTLLTNRDPVVAITAVRSLCRLDASKAIAVLVTNMYVRPHTSWLEGRLLMDPAKMEIVRSIGRVRTIRAKQALLVMGKQMWTDGPHTTLYERTDVDLMYVMAAICHQLERWAADEDVAAFAEEVLADPNLTKKLQYPEFCSYVVRLREVGMLTKAGVTNAFDVATNILFRLSNNRYMGGATNHIEIVLCSISTSVLSNVQAWARTRYQELYKLSQPMTNDEAAQNPWLDREMTDTEFIGYRLGQNYRPRWPNLALQDLE